jgi:hypothetical protein
MRVARLFIIYVLISIVITAIVAKRNNLDIGSSILVGCIFFVFIGAFFQIFFADKAARKDREGRNKKWEK